MPPSIHRGPTRSLRLLTPLYRVAQGNWEMDGVAEAGGQGFGTTGPDGETGRGSGSEVSSDTIALWR
jgi:hypothetical protein